MSEHMTIENCGDCASCRLIAELREFIDSRWDASTSPDRHPDVDVLVREKRATQAEVDYIAGTLKSSMPMCESPRITLR